MANSSNISLPRGKCMKCREESAILLSSSNRSGRGVGNCNHKFCQSCFRIENTNSAIVANHNFACPCCHIPFYENMQSIDEAVLLGEADSIIAYLSPHLLQPADMLISAENRASINKMNKIVIDKLEEALSLHQTNFDTLHLLFIVCSKVYQFLINHESTDSPLEYYGLKLFAYVNRVLSYIPAIPEGYEYLETECYHQLSNLFYVFHNYPAALKYSKLIYERCLRSPNHSDLSVYKAIYLKSRAAFAGLPPLRFAVGDVVEFLYELETGSERKLGKVVELYYRERDFDITFSAPYRLELLDNSDDGPPAYAWVKADLDRYVRKVGVRSIEDTRYQARLDAKVEALAQVYCSLEFTQDIYCILEQDQEFVDMLQSVWQIELTEYMLCLYRMLVMYREPLVRTDTGYHVPSSEEVIAGIRAFFDPVHLSVDSAAGEDNYSRRLRAEILCRFRGTIYNIPAAYEADNFQGLLLDGITCYLSLLSKGGRLIFSAGLPVVDHFTLPSAMSEAISKARSMADLSLIKLGAVRLDGSFYSTKPGQYLSAWIALHDCLDNPNAGPACECPFVYFFVKFCLDHGAGVPKLALAAYDRMNMQLSRDFIRCANPSCELNKLDKSTGKIKFKKCSGCLSVIYCSRECQTAHYPEHKVNCREH